MSLKKAGCERVATKDLGRKTKYLPYPLLIQLKRHYTSEPLSRRNMINMRSKHNYGAKKIHLLIGGKTRPKNVPY